MSAFLDMEWEPKDADKDAAWGHVCRITHQDYNAKASY